ncbi:hypothetical protein ES703_99417 [subsurface metagenome]
MAGWGEARQGIRDFSIARHGMVGLGVVRFGRPW